MAGYISAYFYIDRSNWMLDAGVDWYTPGYSDPETGEYFGNVSWQATFTYESGPVYGTSGYGYENGSEYIGLGLASGGSVARYTFDFVAMNTFSGEQAAARSLIVDGNNVAGPQQLIGDATNDVVIGGEASDELQGLGGSDILDGGDGNDTLLGGAGSDQLIGGSGNNVLDGGADNDLYVVTSSSDTIVELDGGGTSDTVQSTISFVLGHAVERLQLLEGGSLNGSGNSLDNYIFGNSSANQLKGLLGDDNLYGMAGNDRIEGGEGNDVLDGGLGRDSMVGGEGDDTYVVDSIGDQIVENNNAGHDTVIWGGSGAYTLAENVEDFVRAGGLRAMASGNALANRMEGGLGNDKLLGLGGSDLLLGGAGNDILVGGIGADTLNGGAGTDFASYETQTTAVVINLATGAMGAGEPSGDVLIDIEGLIGGSANDRLIGDANANVLRGGLGNDFLDGGLGKDVILGGAGADRMLGGDGVDTLSYADATSGVTINLSTRTASGGDADGDVFSGFENLQGGTGNDILTGNALANVISGGRGADILRGGGGIDTLSYSSSDAAVTVSLAAATASGGDAAGDTFIGFENLTGSAGSDTLIGNGTANVLRGGLGNDTISGGAGDDVIIGGEGSDNLTGGNGIDTLSYADATFGIYASLNEGYSIEGSINFDRFSGFEQLTGSSFGDALYGDDGNNVISGGGGGDVLNGYGGDDRLLGGDGADTFSFGPGGGHDVAVDFSWAAGEVVQLYFGWQFDTFSEVQAVAHATGPGGTSTTLMFDPFTSLTLNNVQISQLNASWFELG